MAQSLPSSTVKIIPATPLPHAWVLFSIQSTLEPRAEMGHWDRGEQGRRMKQGAGEERQTHLQLLLLSPVEPGAGEAPGTLLPCCSWGYWGQLHRVSDQWCPVPSSSTAFPLLA